MHTKLVIKVIFTGFSLFILLFPATLLDAGEQAPTISSESTGGSSDKIDIFNPDVKETFPFADVAHPDEGQVNDQVCSECSDIETDDVVSENNMLPYEHSIMKGE
jgi:hypothetical protein